jgi:hypothetical protein
MVDISEYTTNKVPGSLKKRKIFLCFFCAQSIDCHRIRPFPSIRAVPDARALRQDRRAKRRPARRRRSFSSRSPATSASLFFLAFAKASLEPRAETGHRSETALSGLDKNHTKKVVLYFIAGRPASPRWSAPPREVRTPRQRMRKGGADDRNRHSRGAA